MKCAQIKVIFFLVGALALLLYGLAYFYFFVQLLWLFVCCYSNEKVTKKIQKNYDF